MSDLNSISLIKEESDQQTKNIPVVKKAISVASSDIDAEDRGEVSIATFDGI